jgi:NADPH-dependent 2,4-dienoyl-CoA reductase/sulfur reductase-like enzyme
MSERIVIAGAGLAGLRAAERLRELGFDGEVVVLGAGPDLACHRPALAKHLRTGAPGPDGTVLADPLEVDAEWRFATPVTQLSPNRQVVHLRDGELRYDGLIIATGVEPRRLPGAPHGHPRVVVVRATSDVVALRHALATNPGPVAVVGTGFVGCEVASGLRELGRDVVLVGRARALLADVLGPDIGEWLTALHTARGVRLELGTRIRRWRPAPASVGIEFTDGRALDVACVVVAIGSVPAVSWLRGARLPLDDGVVCEPTCHVAGSRTIVAAGDVARWPNLRFGPAPHRDEHWLNAVEMARAAAANLLAGPPGAVPFTPVPRYWSEQHGVRIQVAGRPMAGTDAVLLESPVPGTRPITGFVRDGGLVGLVGLDSPAAVAHWTAELARRYPVPPAETAPDPEIVRPRHGTAAHERSGVVAG